MKELHLDRTGGARIVGERRKKQRVGRQFEFGQPLFGIFIFIDALNRYFIEVVFQVGPDGNTCPFPGLVQRYRRTCETQRRINTQLNHLHRIDPVTP